MSMIDDPTPDEEAAAARRHDDAVRRGTQLVRRRRRMTGALVGACLLVITGVVALARPSDTRSTKVDVVSPPQSSTTTSTSIAVTAPLEASTTTTSVPSMASTPTEPSSTTTTPTTSATEPTTTTASTVPAQPTVGPTGPGTANLTYSGVLSGQLANAVSYCYSRPSAESEIRVNGTLNGTPWVLFVQSYDGESGVWQVLTGEAGGTTGMVGQGYAATATYPATVEGVTQTDWAHGATLDVQLTSNSGQTPAGDVQVQGTITCDQ